MGETEYTDSESESEIKDKKPRISLDLSGDSKSPEPYPTSGSNRGTLVETGSVLTLNLGEASSHEELQSSSETIPNTTNGAESNSRQDLSDDIGQEEPPSSLEGQRGTLVDTYPGFTLDLGEVSNPRESQPTSDNQSDEAPNVKPEDDRFTDENGVPSEPVLTLGSRRNENSDTEPEDRRTAGENGGYREPIDVLGSRRDEFHDTESRNVRGLGHVDTSSHSESAGSHLSSDASPAAISVSQATDATSTAVEPTENTGVPTKPNSSPNGEVQVGDDTNAPHDDPQVSDQTATTTMDNNNQLSPPSQGKLSNVQPTGVTIPQPGEPSSTGGANSENTATVTGGNASQTKPQSGVSPNGEAQVGEDTSAAQDDPQASTQTDNTAMDNEPYPPPQWGLSETENDQLGAETEAQIDAAEEQLQPYVEAFKPENWNALTPEQRVETLQQIENVLAPLQGREPATVVLQPMDKREYGGFNYGNNTITFNEQHILNNTEPSYEYLDTIIHEGRHAYQWQVRANGEEMGLKQVAALWQNNYDNYIRPEKDPEQYPEQPLEKDAWRYAQRLTARLLGK